MRIAHLAPFAPGQCGLYETVRDIVAGERALGHEAEIVDIGVNGKLRVGETDRGVTARSGSFLKTADVFVVSGGIPEDILAQTRQPCVQILHGRPHASFLAAIREPGKAGYDLMVRRLRERRWPLAIALWARHLPDHRLVLPPEKLRATSAPPLDLTQYTPDGERYQFRGDGPHVLVAEAWREDWDPYETLHALAEMDRPCTVHVCAASGVTPASPWQHVFRGLQRRGMLGEVKGQTRNFIPLLRGADLIIGGHGIATRIVREGLAVGTPVVAQMGCQGALWQYLPCREDMSEEFRGAVEAVVAHGPNLRVAARRSAEAHFDAVKVSRELVGLYAEALGAEATSKAAESQETASPAGARAENLCEGVRRG